MGFRFQKRIRLGKSAKLNLSKRGAGLSFGGKGLTNSVGPSGARTTISARGAGLSYSIQHGARSRRRSARRSSGNATGITILFLLVAWCYSKWPTATLIIGVPLALAMVIGWLFGDRRQQ